MKKSCPAICAVYLIKGLGGASGGAASLGTFCLIVFLGGEGGSGGDPATLPVNNECSMEGENLFTITEIRVTDCISCHRPLRKLFCVCFENHITLSSIYLARKNLDHPHAQT